MKGFPKKIATGNDLYNCLSLVQAGALPADKLSDAINAIEERQYITVPILQISEDRKTIVINPCSEAVSGTKVKNNYTTTIKEAQQQKAEAVLKAFEKIAQGATETLGNIFGKLGIDIGSLISGIGGAAADSTDEPETEELTILTLSRAMAEGENALKILSDKSPFEMLGISQDEIKSIKGVLKNYEQISNE